METITILLVCGAFLGLVAQYLIKEPPFYLMSELLGLGVNDPAFLKKLAHGNDALRKEA